MFRDLSIKPLRVLLGILLRSKAGRTNMTLRQKAEYLLSLGISERYFELLLEKQKISVRDKAYIEKLYKAIT